MISFLFLSFFLPLVVLQGVGFKAGGIKMSIIHNLIIL